MGASDKENILNIIAKKVGYTEITICTVEGTGRNERINLNTGITVGVTVLEDNSGWISETALDSFKVTAIYIEEENLIDFSFGKSSHASTDGYTIEDVPNKPEEGAVYTGNGINYKLVNNRFYFKISDLRELKITK